MQVKPAKHPRPALPTTALGRLILYFRLITVPNAPPMNIPPTDHLSAKFCPLLANNLHERSCHSIKVLLRMANVVAKAPITEPITTPLLDALTKDFANACWSTTYFVGSDGGRNFR